LRDFFVSTHMSDKNIYPIGKFEYGNSYSAAETHLNIKAIEELPSQLNSISVKFTPELLKKSYKPNGWTAQQIFHHIADSHSNALTRVKLALTEHNPVIKPYDQDAWALLADVENTAIEVSLKMTEAIHIRWVAVLNAMSEADFSKKYIHPEYNKEFRLDEFVALYAWHGKHHYGQLNTIINNG
jgi:hypothetical protein